MDDGKTPMDRVRGGRLGLRIRCWAVAVLLLVSGWLPHAAVAAAKSAVAVKVARIAVVRNGPGADQDDFIARVKRELNPMLGSTIRVVWLREVGRHAGRGRAVMAKALDRALRDPRVNLVLALGAAPARRLLAGRSELPKPVLAVPLLDPVLVSSRPAGAGTWRRSNLSWLVTPGLVAGDLEALRRLVPFHHLAVLVGDSSTEGVAGPDRLLRPLARRFHCRITTVSMQGSGARIAANIPADVDAVYLTWPCPLDTAQRRILIDAINQRRLPSFSMAGSRDVMQGVLGGRTAFDMDKLARRTAIHLYRILDGARPERLPREMEFTGGLLINDGTAARIGFSADRDVLIEARQVHPDQGAVDEGWPLSLERSMRIAAAGNIDVGIQRDRVTVIEEDQRRAQSALFPQVSGVARYLKIDHDRARASLGAQPEERTTLGVSARQMIYDDRVVSDYRAAGRLYRGAVFDWDSLRLDVIKDAALRFLDYLAARALARTEADNLELTEHNLELARVRYRVGVAGAQEVYRWEANVDTQKSSLFQARSRIQQARVALNQVLGVDQRIRWNPRDIRLQDSQIYFLDRRMGPLLKKASRLDVFRKFAVEWAFENEPALKAVDQAIEAQRIRLAQVRRAFVLPSFSTTFQYDYEAQRRDSSLPAELNGPGTGAPSGFDLHGDRHDWSWSVVATLPLFEGGRRFHDVARAKAELDRLKKVRTRLRQKIEQRVRSALYALEGSQPNIALSRSAAASAERNLRIVRDRYARGTIPVIDLLDAQHRAFVARQQAVIATYRYLKDLMEFQRAIAWFEPLKSEAERDLLVHRFRAFVEGGKR